MPAATVNFHVSWPGCGRAGGSMARSMWAGAISFGLVNVPVRLYTAVAPKEVHFHMMHVSDNGRIQLKRFCSVDGKEVPYNEIVKGYEISKGRYVVIDPEELERLDFKATHTINIEDFVHLDEIDPIYYDATWRVAPDAHGGKAYALLVAAMESTGMIAIARMVLRTKQHLCALRPSDGQLLLSTMQYADEIVPASALGIEKPEAAPSQKELDMAKQLIDSLTTEFDPAKYRDTYRDRVIELIERKAQGETIVAPEQPERIEAGNLADVLAASLARARREPAAGERRAPAARTRRERPAARTRRTKP